ncbi:hypothetical protein V6N11_038146 [Hibiscus sabdariffa]
MTSVGMCILCNYGLSHRYRSSNKQKFPITTVKYRSFSLLTCTKDGSLSFFRFVQKTMPPTWSLAVSLWKYKGTVFEHPSALCFPLIRENI